MNIISLNLGPWGIYGVVDKIKSYKWNAKHEKKENKVVAQLK